MRRQRAKGSPVAAPVRVEPVPIPTPLSAPPGPPFEVCLRVTAMVMEAASITFDLDVELVNNQSRAADGLRPILALISASPEQDRLRAAFHAGPPPQCLDGEMDLAPGAGVVVPARLTLPRDRLHVVTLGGRPMFVAMLLCDLRWRSGLSIRRFGADFLIGAAGQGPRPAPIWLDRPAPRALATIAYAPAPAQDI